MKFPLVSALAIALAGCATQPTAPSTIAGVYKNFFGTKFYGVDATLTCISETSCSIRFDVTNGAIAPSSVQNNMDNGQPIKDPSMVLNAILYARQNIDRPPGHLSDANLQAEVKRVLPTSVDPKHCVGFSSSRYVQREVDNYYAVCPVSSSVWPKGGVFFMPIVLAGCGANFCVYSIYPLERK